MGFIFFCFAMLSMVILIVIAIIGAIAHFPTPSISPLGLAIIVFLGGGFIGLIVARVMDSRNESERDAEYASELQRYDRLVSEDKKRVEEENRQKCVINSEIQVLYVQSRKSFANLKKMYEYGVIDQMYWHDIVAIASFYQYFRTGRTKSLKFNEETGDQGAYNIYENEKRLNHIITNTDTIIQKLDQIIDNQREIAVALRQAENKISSLNDNVRQISRNATAYLSEIEQNTAISAYNSERQTAELKYLNDMNLIFHTFK